MKNLSGWLVLETRFEFGISQTRNRSAKHSADPLCDDNNNDDDDDVDDNNNNNSIQ
jgi:hypothetical protein